MGEDAEGAVGEEEVGYVADAGVGADLEAGEFSLWWCAGCLGWDADGGL